MKSSSTILILVLGFVIIAAVIATFITIDPINERNFAKIQQGMTEAEVDGILGLPTEVKDLRKFSVFVATKSSDGTMYMKKQISEKTWKGFSMTITIPFIEGGTVAYVSKTEKPIFDRIWQWVGPESID